MQIRSKIIAPTLISIFLMSACGGGGGSSPTPTPTPTPVPVPTPDPTPDPTPQHHTITAIDGYLENARAFIDLNENFSFDASEPNAMTDAQGKVTFDIGGINDALSKPIIVESLVGQTLDKDTNTTVINRYTMIAPGGSEVVSPFTTLVQLHQVKEASDIDAAISDVKFKLGLLNDVDIMADYLTNQTLHVIARSIVQLLPATAEQLFADNTDHQSIFANATAISIGVLEAVLQSGDLDSVFIAVDQASNTTPNTTTKILSIDDVITFVDQVSPWGKTLGDELLLPGGYVASNAQAAVALAKTDIPELLTLLLTFVEGSGFAIGSGYFQEFPANTVIQGATGAVTTQLSTGEGNTALIDIQYNGMTLMATAVYNQEVKLTGSIESDNVRIVLSNGSEIALNNDSNALGSMDLISIVTSTINNSMDTSIAGSMQVDTTTVDLNISTKRTVPTQISMTGVMSGPSTVDTQTILQLLVQASVANEQIVWSPTQATMQLDSADLSLPIGVSFNSLEDNGGSANVVATYGDKVLTVNNPAETGKLAIGDQQGIVMTVNIEGTADATQVGSIYTGVKNVATISRTEGIYTVTYSDGQTQTLF
ncbi:MAG: hypothetical protein HRT35_17610 [Algicola sp.]|nr:hypothetical protein [Algicola sp.]